MFFKSIYKILNNSYDSFNYDQFSKVNPNVIRYFRNEYGKDWKAALNNYLYEQSIKKDKKAA